MMTRKDFDALAAMIKDHVDYLHDHPAKTGGYDDGFRAGYLYGVKTFVYDVIDYATEQNPRFDRDRFLTACGM